MAITTHSLNHANPTDILGGPFIRNGRLTTHEIRQILAQEVDMISTLFSSVNCYFFRFDYLSESYNFNRRDVSIPALVGTYTIDIFTVLLTLSILILTTASLKKGEGKQESFLELLALITIAVMTVPIAAHISGDIHLSIGGLLCIRPRIISKLKTKQEAIQKLIHTISLSASHQLSPLTISKLIHEYNFSEYTTTSLLRAASLHESKYIFEDLDRRGFNPLSLPDSLTSQQKLITTMPTDYDRFSALIDDVEIRNTDDYLFLLRQIPREDRRITCIPKPREISTGSCGAASGSDVLEEVVAKAGTMITIKANNESILVNKEQLIAQSSYFRSLLSHHYCDQPNAEGAFILHSDLNHQQELIVMLKNIGCLENFLGQLTKKIKPTGLPFFEAAITYGFDSAILQLGTALFNSTFLTTSKKIDIGTTVVACDPTICQNEEWNEQIYQYLKSTAFTGRPVFFSQWLHFAVAQNFVDATKRLGYLMKERNKKLPPRVVMGLVNYLSRFKSLETRLTAQITEEFQENSPSLVKYSLNPKFVEWLASQIEDPHSQCITLFNFRLIWEDKKWNSYPSIKRALLQFATRSGLKDAMVGLWPPGEAPDELLHLPL